MSLQLTQKETEDIVTIIAHSHILDLKLLNLTFPMHKLKKIQREIQNIKPELNSSLCKLVIFIEDWLRFLAKSPIYFNLDKEKNCILFNSDYFWQQFVEEHTYLVQIHQNHSKSHIIIN